MLLLEPEKRLLFIFGARAQQKNVVSYGSPVFLQPAGLVTVEGSAPGPHASGQRKKAHASGLSE